MTSYNIPTGNLYKDWTIEMGATFCDSSLTFIEHLYNQNLNVGITGRTLTVSDIQTFEKAANITMKPLETFLNEKNDKGNLNVEHLQRLCERHGIRYDLTGDRPATAHRKYIKMMRDTRYDRQHKGFWLCEKAQRRLKGTSPGTPVNLDAAEEFFKEALSIGYLPGYAQLGKFYYDAGREADAIKTVEKGVKLGDAESMILLAQILTKQTAPDYKQIAGLYFDASEKGYCQKAASGLHKLINEGHYVPKSDQYMKLIGIVARRHILLKEAIESNPLLDPDLVHPRNMLLEDNPDIPAARQLLTKALEKTKTQAYGGLAKCDILEKRWGRAAENVMKGIEGGDAGTCLIYATRLALMGADFVNFTDELGQPDYEAVLKWSMRCIDEDLVYGFQILYHLAEIGVLKIKDIETPELAERCKHFLDNIPESKRADIYCEAFDVERN